jgi:hypothetical protein
MYRCPLTGQAPQAAVAPRGQGRALGLGGGTVARRLVRPEVGPHQGQRPQHQRDDAHPAADADGVGLRMVARACDLAGKTPEAIDHVRHQRGHDEEDDECQPS